MDMDILLTDFPREDGGGEMKMSILISRLLNVNTVKSTFLSKRLRETRAGEGGRWRDSRNLLKINSHC